MSETTHSHATLGEAELRALIHDLRNTLGGSRGLLEALLADPTIELDDDVRQDLRLVADGVRDGMQLLEQRLVDVTR